MPEVDHGRPTRTVNRDGTVEYRNADGRLHRTDGPAIENPNGYKAWVLNGQTHRSDGPAVDWADGTGEWWLNGQEYPNEEAWFAALPLEAILALDDARRPIPGVGLVADDPASIRRRDRRA